MKRTFSLLLLLLALLTVLPTNALGSSSYYDGDTLQNPIHLSRGAGLSSVLGNDRQYEDGVYTGVSNQTDYYTFTLDTATKVTITTASSSTGRSSMYTTLLNASQVQIARKYGSTALSETLDPGTYYVLVEYYQKTSVYYTLSLDYCLHQNASSQVYQPSCTTQGYTVYVCSNCGLSWEGNYVSPRHSYGAYTTTVAPTCTTSGTSKAVCTVCGATTTRTLAALGHTVSNWTVIEAPSCTTDSTETGVCSVCKQTLTQKKPATGHSYSDWEITKETSCRGEGSKRKICGNCGDVITETIPALGHKETLGAAAVDPTCEETGSTERTDCSVCGAVLVPAEIIPALGHKEILGAAAVDPTCEETGLTERTDCSVCGKVLVPAETVPALGHTEVKDPAIAPTCSQSGKKEGSHCGVCGKILVYQQTISPLPHTEVFTQAVAPTCTEPGRTMGKTCSVCKTDLIRSLELPPLGHQKVIDTPAVPATCTAGGMSEGYHCSVCGITEAPKATAPTPHNYLSGKCVYCGQPGTGWTWEISGTTLTISGTGAMTDFATSEDVPWSDQSSTIKTVIVENGITHIGKYAFYGFNAMTSVTLPDSVTTIGSHAFSFCSSLTGITLPKKLTEISDYAFYYCKMSTLTIPNSVTHIGNSAFRNSSLSSIDLPDSVTRIGDYAFYQCSALKNVYMSSYTNSIGQYAFSQCSYLQYVSLPDNLIELGNHAFYKCENLQSVYLNNGLLRIGDYAFDYCPKLSYVTFPDSITHIGNSAFEDCAKLSFSKLPANLITIGDSAFDGCTYNGYYATLSLPENLVSIGAYAFRDNRYNSITIPASLTSIGKDAFDDTSLDDIYITDLAAWVTNCSGYGTNLVYCNGLYKELYLNGELLTDVVIPDGVTAIGSNAFNYFDEIISVTLPDSVAQIGENAFRYCIDLTSITLPANVKSLGSYAFDDSGLKTITFRGRAPAFGSDVFSNCTVTAYYPGQDPSWTSSVRGNYGGTVTWKAMTCTGDHTEAVDKAEAPTCTEVGWTEGKRCSVCGLALVPRESIPAKGHFVLGPDQTLVSPDTMEPDCTNAVSCAVCKEVLKEPLGHRVIVKKPYNVVNEDEFPFVLRGDRYYSNTQAAETTSEIQFKVNYNCKLTLDYGISSEHYHGSLSILLNDTSKDYINGIVEQESLTLNVYAGDTLEVRYRSLGGQDAVYDRGWVTVQYAQDQPQIIVPAESLEAGCAPIVCDFCQAVVKDAPGHKEVTDPGIEATCNLGGLTEGKHCSVCEEILVSQEEIPALGHDFADGVCTRCGLSGGGTVVAEGECGTNVGWKLYDSGLLLITGEGPMSSYISSTHPWRSHLDSITDIIIEEGVASISSSAFTGFANLETISIPEGVTSVGDYAFQNCAKLKEVVLPTSVKSSDSLLDEGDYMFDGCSSLESVTLPEGLTSIGDYMFRNCKKLTAVEIPSTVTEIGSNAFYYCSALKTVTLQGGLKTIGSSAFYKCSALTEIVIPETVTSIGNYAFYYCSALTEITIPGSVMAIHEDAFCNCGALKKITFSGRAPGIGNDAFSLVRATALYPENYGWQEGDLQNYGGKLTWQSYDDGTGGIDLTETLASGECGTDLRWVLTGDGTLTISGNGAMPDYGTYSNNPPWQSYSGWIDHVVLEEGVTAVGNYAFSGCFGLRSVSISGTVQKIGNYAFEDCSGLKEIVIPEGVTELGACVFYYCNALEKVTLPAGLTEISSHAFSLCYALREINIPDSVTTISASAFYGCDALTEITIPGSVTTISDSAFYNCDQLEEITFSGSAPTISGNAFQYVEATAWYPAGDATWTSEAQQHYGGTLTWKAGCAGGHTPVTTPAVAPTCTETGLTDGTHCSACNKVLTPQSTVPAAGHSYGEPTFEWNKKYPRVSCKAVFPCRNCSATKSVSCSVTETPTDTVGEAIYTATLVLDGNSYTEQLRDQHQFHSKGTLHSNNDFHWYDCALCGVKLSNTKHTPGPEATATTSQKCTVCDRILQLPLELEWVRDSADDPDSGFWASGYYAQIMEQYGPYLNNEPQ